MAKAKKSSNNDRLAKLHDDIKAYGQVRNRKERRAQEARVKRSIRRAA